MANSPSKILSRGNYSSKAHSHLSAFAAHSYLSPLIPSQDTADSRQQVFNSSSIKKIEQDFNLHNVDDELTNSSYTTEDTYTESAHFEDNETYHIRYSVLHLLQLLHKITKDKPLLLLSLVQCKMFAVLKRILNQHSEPLIDRFACKLCKSQLPFLGKKFRRMNLPTITRIYQSLEHRLFDDYLTVIQLEDSAECDCNTKNLESNEKEMTKLYEYWYNVNFSKRQESLHWEQQLEHTQLEHFLLENIEFALSLEDSD